MRSALLVLAITAGLAIGTAIPTSAIGFSQATLTCDDGTTSTLVVDANTLVGLTQAVQAMIDYPAGLTCTLAQVPLLSFGAVALAANEPFVVGGGRYLLPCEEEGSGLPGPPSGGGAPVSDAGSYWVNIAVNAHQKGTEFVGTLNETIPEHQCVPHGHFTSKPTCLSPTEQSAVITTLVTQTSQVTKNNFFKAVTVTPGESTRFSFLDTGNPGQQLSDDKLDGIYSLSDLGCSANPVAPTASVPLVHGNITVHP